MATFTVEITPDSINGTIAHATGKYSGGSSSYKGQRRMDVTVSGVGTFSALSPETSGGENTFSLDITGLTPGTTYNWSASLYYKNTSGGWVTAGSQYDRTGSFTTKSGAAAAHKTIINGTAYEVKGGKCMVNGTVYNILKGRTLIDGTGYDIALSSAGTKIETLNVGQSVYANVGGVRKEFIVVHQGLPSSLYDASCDGTWLLMKDIYDNRQWNSRNSNAYETSDINTYLNGPFFNLFDSNIQGIIKQVKIPYRKNGGSGDADQSGANGLSAKIFLLSGYEVGWTTSNHELFPQDGTKLSYFESGTGTSANKKRTAYLNGSAAIWWLRSPSIGYTDRVWRIGAGGSYDYNNVFSSFGIRPALILPSDALVNDEFELIA